MNGWRVQWLSELWDASSSTSIPLPTTEEARAGGGTRAMSVALMLSELGIRAGLALPTLFPGAYFSTSDMPSL